MWEASPCVEMYLRFSREVKLSQPICYIYIGEEESVHLMVFNFSTLSVSRGRFCLEQRHMREYVRQQNSSLPPLLGLGLAVNYEHN